MQIHDYPDREGAGCPLRGIVASRCGVVHPSLACSCALRCLFRRLLVRSPNVCPVVHLTLASQASTAMALCVCAWLSLVPGRGLAVCCLDVWTWCLVHTCLGRDLARQRESLVRPLAGPRNTGCVTPALQIRGRHDVRSLLVRVPLVLRVKCNVDVTFDSACSCSAVSASSPCSGLCALVSVFCLWARSLCSA